MVKGKRCHPKRSRSRLYQNFKQENAIEEEIELENEFEDLPLCKTPKIQEKTVVPSRSNETTDSDLSQTVILSEQRTLIKDQPYRSSLREKIILKRIINLTERKSDYLLLNGPLYIKKSSLKLLDYQLESMPLENVFGASEATKGDEDYSEAEPYFVPFNKKLIDENMFFTVTPNIEKYETNIRNADILFYQFKPKEPDKPSQSKEPTDKPQLPQFEPPETEYTTSTRESKPPKEFTSSTREYKPPTMEHTLPSVQFAHPPTEHEILPPMEREPYEPYYPLSNYNLPTQSPCPCQHGTYNIDPPTHYSPTNQCSPECKHNPISKYHFKTQPPCSMKTQPCSIKTQPCLMKTQPCSITTQPCSMNAQPCSNTTQPCSMNAQPCSITTQPCSMNAQPCSITTQPCSMNAQPCSITTQPCSIKTQPCSSQCSPNCKFNHQQKSCIPKCSPECTYRASDNFNQCSPECNPKPKCCCARPIDNCNQYYPECKPKPNCNQCSKCKPKPKCFYARPIENCCNQYIPPKCPYVDKCTQCYTECLPKPKCLLAKPIVTCSQHYPECTSKSTCSHGKPFANCNQFYPNNRPNLQNECNTECKFNNTQPIYFFLNEGIYECDSEGEICSASSDTIPDPKPDISRDYQIIKSPFNRHHNNNNFRDLSDIRTKYKSFVENMFFSPPQSLPSNERATDMQPIYCCFGPAKNYFIPKNEDGITSQTKYSENISTNPCNNRAEVKFQPDEMRYPEYDIIVQGSAKQCSSKCTFSTIKNCTCGKQFNSRCSPGCSINVQTASTTQFNAQPKCSCGLQIDGTCSSRCDITVESSINQYCSQCTCNTQPMCTCDQLNGTCSPECNINIQDDTTNQCSPECSSNTNPKCTCETTNQCSSTCTFNTQPKCTCCININSGCSPQCDINTQDDVTTLLCSSQCQFNIQPNYFSPINCTCQQPLEVGCSLGCGLESGCNPQCDPNPQDTFVNQCSSDCTFNLQPMCTCGILVSCSTSNLQSNACKCHIEGANLQEASTKPCTSDFRINSQANCICGSSHKCSSECYINAPKQQLSSIYSLKTQPRCPPECIVNKNDIEVTTPGGISSSHCSNLQQLESELHQKCSSNCELVLTHFHGVQDAHPKQRDRICQIKKLSKCDFTDQTISKCISHEYGSKNIECPFVRHPNCFCGEEYECSSECDNSKWKNGSDVGADQSNPDSNIDNTKSKKNIDNEALRICRRCCERNKQVIKVTRDKEKIEQVSTCQHPMDEEEKLLHSCLLCCKQAKCVGTSSEISYQKCGIKCSFCMESSKPRSANPLDITDSEAEFLVNSYVPQKTCDFTLSECQMKKTHGDKYGDVKYHFLMVDISTEKNQVVDSSTSSSATNLHDDLAERRKRKAKKITSKRALEANKKLLERKLMVDEKKKAKEPMEPIYENLEPPSQEAVFYSHDKKSSLSDHQKRLSIVSWNEEQTNNLDKMIADLRDKTKESDQKPSIFEEIIKQEKRKIDQNQGQQEAKYPQYFEKDRDHTDRDHMELGYTDRDHTGSRGWLSFLRKKKRHARSIASTVSQKISLLDEDEDEVDDEGSDLSVSQLVDQLHKENESKSLDSYRRRISPIEKPVSEKDNKLNRYLNNLNVT